MRSLILYTNSNALLRTVKGNFDETSETIKFKVVIDLSIDYRRFSKAESLYRKVSLTRCINIPKESNILFIH